MPTQCEVNRLRKLIQRRHRVELALARLKRRSRRDDTRQKFRLGGLVTLVEPLAALPLSQLELQLDVAARCLVDTGADHERFRAIGDAEFRKLKALGIAPNRYDPDLADEDRRAINHRRITIGGAMIAAGLGEADPAIVLGALLDTINGPTTGDRP